MPRKITVPWRELAGVPIGKSEKLVGKGQFGHVRTNTTEGPVQLTWRKASFCASGECVEVAQRDGAIILRDSTQPAGRMLHWSAEEWRAFVGTVKAG